MSYESAEAKVAAKRARQLKDHLASKCWCGNVAGLNQTLCGRHRPDEPITIRYETDSMHIIRQLLTAQGFSDEDVDTFKGCLSALEGQGFTLMRKYP